MTFKKGFGSLGVLVIVLGILMLGGIGGYVVLQPNVHKDAAVPDTQKIKEPTIDWKFESAGEANYAPYTKVSVTVNGVIHEVGNFQGSCSQVGTTGGVDGKGLLAGELSAAQCWFAGGGDEIGVFATEDGGFELMTGGLSEGTEGSEFFRGDFKIREEIKL